MAKDTAEEHASSQTPHPPVNEKKPQLQHGQTTCHDVLGRQSAVPATQEKSKAGQCTSVLDS